MKKPVVLTLACLGFILLQGCNVFYIAGSNDGVDVRADLNNLSIHVDRAGGEIPDGSAPEGVKTISGAGIFLEF